MQDRGWARVDIVLVTGDAYVDHPSFGAAMIGRVLERDGFRVGLIAMPDWRDPSSITVFGEPRLFFGVTSGNVDSMIAHFTAFKKRRSDDPYAPGGIAGKKPERAVIVYCNLIKSVYKNVPIILGGIEASMRRVAHYDFWSDQLRRSILLDSRADILVYGMGEKPIVEIAHRLARKDSLDGIPGTVILAQEPPSGAKLLPAEEDVLTSKEQFIVFYRRFYRQQRFVLAQPVAKRFLLHYPAPDVSSAELDRFYDLPFTRQPHPSYDQAIPAFEMIRHSVISHRGCVSGCSFCTLGLHQGKRIVSRSEASILNEVDVIAAQPDFKGHITDVGGPSANMYGMECGKNWCCSRESCLFPSLCPHLKLASEKWLGLLGKAARRRRVKRVTVGSGIRYDVLLREAKARSLLRRLLKEHVSGQLKIAPEHTSSVVLRAMRKTPLVALDEFLRLFREIAADQGKRQHPLPYLMTCHPGSSEQEMISLRKDVLRHFRFLPEQIQAFIPLPMTLSSVIYFTGIDPLTRERFFVERTPLGRRRQQRLLAGTP